MKTIILLLLGIFGMTVSFSHENAIIPVAPYDMRVFDEKIAAFFKASTHTDKLRVAAEFFVGQPYLLEPLGEGPAGLYSQEPLYRTDRFDCVSYVNTVLALLYAHHPDGFKKNLSEARYGHASPEYRFRTDWFTDLEWIPNIQRLGWIQNVTENVRDRDGQSIAKKAETRIDKPNWYRMRPLQAMHRFSPLPSDNEAMKLLESLRAYAEYFSAQPSSLDYLPLDRLFDRNHRPDPFLFDQIPSGSVVFIVRPDWQIRDNFDRFPGYPQGYGTNLNVSHMGFVLRTAEGLMFYNASTVHQKVEAEPLETYLAKFIDSPTVKGIHVEKIPRQD